MIQSIFLLICFNFCFVPDNDLLQNIFDDNIVEIVPVYEQGIKNSGLHKNSTICYSSNSFLYYLVIHSKVETKMRTCLLQAYL